jgi:hypothetical protein
MLPKLDPRFLRPLQEDSDKRQNLSLARLIPNRSGGVAKGSEIPNGSAKCMKTIQNNKNNEIGIPGYLI